MLTLAIAGATASTAGAVPQLLFTGNTTFSFALDGDEFYWGEYDASEDPAFEGYRIRSTTLPNFAPLTRSTSDQWVDQIAARNGRFAYLIDSFRFKSKGTSSSRDTIFVSEPSLGTVRKVVSGTYAWVGRNGVFCGSAPTLGNIDDDGSVVYGVIRNPRKHGWHCSRHRVRSKFYKTGLAQRADLPPSPIGLGEVKGEAWGPNTTAAGIFYNGDERVSLLAPGSKPRALARPASHLRSVSGEVNQLGQLIVTQSLVQALFDDDVPTTKIVSSPAPGAPQQPLEKGFFYQFCGSNLVRFTVGKSSSIETVANPFVVSSQAPRVILPPSAVNIRDVQCNGKWIVFKTIKYAAGSLDNVFVDQL